MHLGLSGKRLVNRVEKNLLFQDKRSESQLVISFILNAQWII